MTSLVKIIFSSTIAFYKVWAAVVDFRVHLVTVNFSSFLTHSVYFINRMVYIGDSVFLTKLKFSWTCAMGKKGGG